MNITYTNMNNIHTRIELQETSVCI